MKSEENYFRIRRFAIGRKGYQPVVSLPETHALRLIKFKQYSEIFAILLFLASVLLFLSDVVGSGVPTVIGMFVIGFRGAIIILSQLIIAKTVVREVGVSSKEPDWIVGKEQFQNNGDLFIKANVRDTNLHLKFVNPNPKDIFYTIEVHSESGIIEAPKKVHNIAVDRRANSFEVVVELVAKTLSGPEQGDTLNVQINASSPGSDEHQIGEFFLPVMISGSNRMQSETIREYYDYEVIHE